MSGRVVTSILGGEIYILHTHMYIHMGNKNISISDEAYMRLYKLKGKEESFTDVINKLTKRTSILDLEGVLSKRETNELKSAIANLRIDSENRMKEITERVRKK